MKRNMLLVVKGSPTEAIQALRAHAEEAAFEVLASDEPESLYLGPSGGRGIVVHSGSTTLRASLTYTEAAHWFAAAPYSVPYPAGALLWFKDFSL